jgi:hypothetical protein
LLERGDDCVALDLFELRAERCPAPEARRLVVVVFTRQL